MDLVNTPFVSDTLARLLAEDVILESMGPETPWTIAGENISRDPRVVRLNPQNVYDRQKWALMTGQDSASWGPESVLTHEIGHSLDLTRLLPRGIEAKVFQELYAANPDLTLAGDPTIGRHVRTIEEGLANALQEAMLFVRDQGPYVKEENQNLVRLGETPGAVSMLSFIGDKL